MTAARVVCSLWFVVLFGALMCVPMVLVAVRPASIIKDKTDNILVESLESQHVFYFHADVDDYVDVGLQFTLFETNYYSMIVLPAILDNASDLGTFYDSCDVLVLETEYGYEILQNR